MAVLDKNGTEYLWNKAKEKFAAKDDVPKTPEGVLLYTEQSLTDSQKAQARGNIGAVKSWEELEDKPFGETLGELCSVENGVFDEANGYVAIENVSGFPKAGEVCTVVINGTLYENVPVSDLYGITVVGDSDFFSTYTPNEDIPFIITSGFFNEYGWDFVDTVGMMNGSLKDSYSVAVYGTVTKQLDEKYVPTPDWEAEEGGKGHILNKPFSAKLHTEHTWDGDISNGVSVIVKEDGNGKQYGYYRISNNVDVGFSNNDGEGYAYYAGGKTAENESIAYSVDLMERVYTKQEVSYYVDEHLKAITPENCVCIRTVLQRTVFGTAFEKGVWLRFVIGEDGNIIEYTSELKHYIINHLATALESPHQRSISVTTNEIYLHSSTSGSTKKFKLTVDDTGTISATEVV